jgi:hypothetical protein
VNYAIAKKPGNERKKPEKNKDWPDEAIADLGSVVDQVCAFQEEYMKVNGIYIRFLFHLVL